MELLDFLIHFGVTSDLAAEAHALLRGATKREVPGVREDKETYPQAQVTTITILNQEGARALGKPVGTYITIEAPELLRENPPAHEEIAKILGQKLSLLLDKWKIGKSDPVLVVGLGNWQATPDSLGPKVIGQFTVTRHLFKYAPQSLPPGAHPVSALAPGVLGTTGIETAEIIKGVVEKTRPRALIAIDALAAADLRRIGTSIQISDGGISPGGGIGNPRQNLSRENMGIPLIAIGIPTVVHAGVIVYHTIQLLQQEIPEAGFKLNRSLAEKLTAQVLAPFGGNLTVTPKEIDDMIYNQAWVISQALNQALHAALLASGAALPLH